MINDTFTGTVPEKCTQSQEKLPSLWSQGWETLQARVLHPIENGRCRIRLRCKHLTIENGRVWIRQRRCHHGLTGVLLVGAGIAAKQPAVILVGAALCWDDKEDYPWPMNIQ